MTDQAIRERNALLALRFGIINWFQYFEIMRGALVLALCFSLSACAAGGGSGSAAAPTGPAPISCSTLAGLYLNDAVSGNTLTIPSDCTLTDSYCAYDATYTVPDQATGGTTVTVISNNSALGCMPVGAHACTIEYATISKKLAVVCDAGAYSYLFTKQ